MSRVLTPHHSLFTTLVAATATTVAAAVSAEPAASAAATASFGSGLGFVDLQSAAIRVLAVQGRNGGLGLPHCSIRFACVPARALSLSAVVTPVILLLRAVEIKGVPTWLVAFPRAGRHARQLFNVDRQDQATRGPRLQPRSRSVITSVSPFRTTLTDLGAWPVRRCSKTCAARAICSAIEAWS